MRGIPDVEENSGWLRHGGWTFRYYLQWVLSLLSRIGIRRRWRAVRAPSPLNLHSLIDDGDCGNRARARQKKPARTKGVSARASFAKVIQLPRMTGVIVSESPGYRQRACGALHAFSVALRLRRSLACSSRPGGSTGWRCGYSVSAE